MLRLLIPLVFLILGVGGGIGAGLFLSGDDAEDTHAAADDTHAEEDDHGAEDGHGAQDDHADSGHGDDHGASPANGSTEYVRLNNQFVVPIVRHGNVRSLVVMALTLEVDAGSNSDVFQHEPRLRDAFLQVMFAHANVGGFDGTFTEAGAMAPLRSGLQEAAIRILGDTAKAVLIVDITRQDA